MYFKKVLFLFVFCALAFSAPQARAQIEDEGIRISDSGLTQGGWDMWGRDPNTIRLYLQGKDDPLLFIDPNVVVRHRIMAVWEKTVAGKGKGVIGVYTNNMQDAEISLFNMAGGLVSGIIELTDKDPVAAGYDIWNCRVFFNVAMSGLGREVGSVQENQNLAVVTEFFVTMARLDNGDNVMFQMFFSGPEELVADFHSFIEHGVHLTAAQSNRNKYVLDLIPNIESKVNAPGCGNELRNLLKDSRAEAGVDYYVPPEPESRRPPPPVVRDEPGTAPVVRDEGDSRDAMDAMQVKIGELELKVGRLQAQVDELLSRIQALEANQ